MKKVLNFFGIEWCLIIIAIFYIDPSAAMLAIMLVGPVAAAVFFGINFIIKKYEQKIILRRIFGILRIISILAAIAASVFIINYGIKKNSPDEIFKSIIVNPIPKSVKDINRSGNISAMGSSSIYITFNISRDDFDAILKSQRFSEFRQNDVNNISGRRPELYNEMLNDAKKYVSNASEIYIFEHPNSAYRFDALIVNTEHTRAYYGSK